jgi:hypothetical protein
MRIEGRNNSHETERSTPAREWSPFTREVRAEDRPVTHILPESQRFIRDFAVGDVLDMKNVAQTFHDAKKPEEIYRALHPLHAEHDAVQKFEAEYKKLYPKSLDRDIKKRLNPNQQRHAFALLGRETHAEDPLSSKVPIVEKDFDTLAQNLHNELCDNRQGEVNVENVYRLLTPLQRNTELLSKLDDSYRRRHNLNLREHLQTKLQGSAGDYSQYLLGDSKMEQKTISRYEAKQLTKALSHMTFPKDDGGRSFVPFQHPDNGCEDRAHLMGQALKEIGIASDKIFIAAYTPNNHLEGLRFPTTLAKDSRIGKPDRENIEWGYHVAICIRVREESGLGTGTKTAERVIDPGVAARPGREHKSLFTTDEWVGSVDSDHREIRYIKNQNELRDAMREEYMKGVYVFSAPRSMYALPLSPLHLDAIDNETLPDKFAHEAFSRKDNVTGSAMEENAREVPLTQLAGHLRLFMHGDKDTTSQALHEQFWHYDPDTMQRFVRSYPNLLRHFKKSERYNEEFKKSADITVEQKQLFADRLERDAKWRDPFALPDPPLEQYLFVEEQ